MDELRQMFALTVYETTINGRQWQVYQCHWVQSEEIRWVVVPVEYAPALLPNVRVYPSLEAAIAARGEVWA